MRHLFLLAQEVALLPGRVVAPAPLGPLVAGIGSTKRGPARRPGFGSTVHRKTPPTFGGWIGTPSLNSFTIGVYREPIQAGTFLSVQKKTPPGNRYCTILPLAASFGRAGGHEDG